MYADDAGAWLVSHRDDMDRGEARWLSALARFDLDQGWYGDGQLSCVDWLMLHTKMGRATAFENLRVARQLHRRPLIAEAFAAGRLSYSAVRVITRIDDPDVDVDAALVDLAEAGTVADLERAVRFYQGYADQDRPPPDPSLRRQVQVVRHYDGTGEVHVTLTEVELEEFAGALQVFLDGHDHVPTVDQSPCGESQDPSSTRSAASAESPYGKFSDPAPAESPREDSAVRVPVQARAGRRADAQSGGGTAVVGATSPALVEGAAAGGADPRWGALPVSWLSSADRRPAPSACVGGGWVDGFG